LAAHFSGGEGALSLDELREGLMGATVMASFTLEAFGTEALTNVSESDYLQRLAKYKTMLGH
jgi:hypothetical protein